MAWEVRFFVDGRASGAAPRDRPSLFRTEADALTHARVLLDRAPEGCAEVFHREARRRAVYRSARAAWSPWRTRPDPATRSDAPRRTTTMRMRRPTDATARRWP